MRGGVGVTVAGVVLQCPGSRPSWAALPRAYSHYRGRGLRARLFCDPGARVSQKAATPEVAHQALAVKELFEPRDRWSSTDPFEYRARPPIDLFEYR